MVFSSSRFDHITPLLRQLHWLKVPDRIDYQLVLLVYKCLQGVAPSYLADDLCCTADVEARHCLRSASSLSLMCAVRVCRRTATELSRSPPRESGTVCYITSAQSLPFLQSSEDSSLQSQFLLTTLSCLRSDTCHHGHVNRCSYLLTYPLIPPSIGRYPIIVSF